MVFIAKSNGLRAGWNKQKKKKTPYYITDTARINILNIVASNCAKDPIESVELFR